MEFLNKHKYLYFVGLGILVLGIVLVVSFSQSKLNPNRISGVTVLAKGDFVIKWTNQAIEAEARGQLDKPKGDIKKSELSSIKILRFEDVDLEIFDDIRYFDQLVTLATLNCNINDISALKDLTELTDLMLIAGSISDISVLKSLTKLTDLWLGNNNITDISTLKNLTKLTGLRLSKNYSLKFQR